MAAVPEAASAAAHGDDDFEAVSVRQLLVVETAARYDLAVALQRDAPARELQPFDQLGNAQRSLEALRFAIDGQCDHVEANSAG